MIYQSFTNLRQNPLLSIISIAGTAFAITMIMSIVITWQTKYADFAPEVNRSRSLYVMAMHIYNEKNSNEQSFGFTSPAFLKECVLPLKGIEAATAFSGTSGALVSLTDGSNRLKVDRKTTDAGFWKVFKPRFLEGRGFNEGEGMVGVVTASVARKLFGKTEVTGQHILLNRVSMRIVGVVEDVSVAAKDAYAQVWVPYSPDMLQVTNAWSYSGDMNIAMVAKSTADFPSIREELSKRVEAVNAGLGDHKIDIMDQPDNIVAHVNHVWCNVGPDLTMLYLQYILALVIILLVPSLNLCGLSGSRMQQRMAELGVRKAFGATKGVLVRQILNENLFLTLLGGVAGLLLSYLSVYLMREWLFTNSDNIGTSGEFSLSMSLLFSPWVCLLAFA
ncbi:MAG: ABC transporter permease, partial [Bacteroides sp.]|nr:ABC transporter permease [Bacteroides sp.]